jgi:aryl-alcohol dehydrogenase-like predicted oxidoreductase
MLNRVRYGRTGLEVSRLGLGCVGFGTANKGDDWDPFSAGGRQQAIRTIHCALDAGINYFDTSPDYGDGHSESVVGEALEEVRDRVIIATKVSYGGCSAADVRQSILDSLRRLRTDHIDILQLHGGNYSEKARRHIFDHGLFEVLSEAQAKGQVRFLGFTVNDPVTAREMIQHESFTVIQMMYNFIEQAAARHALDWARSADMGVTVMRPLTAGTLGLLLQALVPQWTAREDVFELALKFVLSDSRVDMINVGMRWEHEVTRNVELVSGYSPTFDVATIPRSVGEFSRYRSQLAQQGS